MTLPRRAAVAVALLAGAWIASPAVVPIYDGPGQPDQPYRYVVAPPGDTKKTPDPTPATATMPIRNGVSTAGLAYSAESGPQVRVYIPPGALQAPPGATSIRLTATPSAPQPPLPSDGEIVGNVYTITLTATGGDVTVTAKSADQTPTLQLRAPTARQPGPVFERFDGKKWTQSETIRAGQDIYQTAASQLGVWALVQLKAGGSALGAAQLAMLVIGIAILVIVGIIMVVRMTRSGATPPPRTGGRRPPARAPAKRAGARR